MEMCGCLRVDLGGAICLRLLSGHHTLLQLFDLFGAGLHNKADLLLYAVLV